MRKARLTQRYSPREAVTVDRDVEQASGNPHWIVGNLYWPSRRWPSNMKPRLAKKKETR